jgi:SAM-dependent methyltransferase
VTNDFLHTHPSLYERVFEASADNVCLEVFQKHLGRMPMSLLDVGCGTGRDLYNLSRHCADCVGVDVVPAMIEFAMKNYPGISFAIGDMRGIRLGRTFDVIMVLGSALNYMRTNEELDEALETFGLHSHPSTLLIIEPFNTTSFVATTKIPTDFAIVSGDLVADGTASYQWDATTQCLERTRTWTFDDDGAPITDAFSLRLLFAHELAYILQSKGFRVVDILERQRSQIYPKSMYIVATRIAER